MKIYTQDDYLNEYDHINHYDSEMVVFHDDLKVIDSYTKDELHTYLDNAEKSLQRLANDSLLDILTFHENRYEAEKMELYKAPFTLFCQCTFSGMNYRMSIAPYTKDKHEFFDLANTADDRTFTWNGKTKYRGNVGDFVKSSSDNAEQVKQILCFFIAYMNSKLLDAELSKKQPKPTTKRTSKI